MVLAFTVTAIPPEWRIAVTFTRDGRTWMPFERLPREAQLYAAQAIEAWAKVHQS